MIAKVLEDAFVLSQCHREIKQGQYLINTNLFPTVLETERSKMRPPADWVFEAHVFRSYMIPSHDVINGRKC